MSTRPVRIAYRLLVALVIAAVALPGAAEAAPGPRGWPTAGQNVQDTHSAGAERSIGAGNVSRLAMLWSDTTAGDVSATPTEADGTVYFPDWGTQLCGGGRQRAGALVAQHLRLHRDPG
jgi:polyvinyl alcohol dehydrogenase (cytochrome)